MFILYKYKLDLYIILLHVITKNKYYIFDIYQLYVQIFIKS